MKNLRSAAVMVISFFLTVLFVASCKKEEQIPVVGTTMVRYVTHSSAIVVGTVSDEGRWGIVEKGVCWSVTNTAPTINDNRKNSDSQTGTGDFQIPLAFLTPNTTYYIRTFARSDAGISYGQPQQFTTKEVVYLKDTRDGQHYPTVVIGTQTWMAANLNFATQIGSVVQPGSSQIPGVGRLYNWVTACQACPSGWRLPTDQDWKQLEITLGLQEAAADLTGGRGIIVGQRVKMPDYDLWSGYPGIDKVLMNQVTNDSGLSIVPGGYYELQTNQFSEFRTTGFYWTFTEESNQKGRARSFTDNSNTSFRTTAPQEYYYSVRCIQ